MKQRIKVVLEKGIAEDGHTVKAWLQYDLAVEHTIQQCRLAFAKQLGLSEPDSLELYIDGQCDAFVSSGHYVLQRR